MIVITIYVCLVTNFAETIELLPRTDEGMLQHFYVRPGYFGSSAHIAEQ
jgi:hypothetical protein